MRGFQRPAEFAAEDVDADRFLRESEAVVSTAWAPMAVAMIGERVGAAEVAGEDGDGEFSALIEHHDGRVDVLDFRCGAIRRTTAPSETMATMPSKASEQRRNLVAGLCHAVARAAVLDAAAAFGGTSPGEELRAGQARRHDTAGDARCRGG